MIGRLLPGFFPELPGQSQYSRRLRRLTPQITTVQLMVAELIADRQVASLAAYRLYYARRHVCARLSPKWGASL